MKQLVKVFFYKDRSLLRITTNNKSFIQVEKFIRISNKVKLKPKDKFLEDTFGFQLPVNT